MSNVPGVPSTPNLDAIRITTQAGGTLTYANVDSWLSPNIDNPLEDATVVDVYIEQVSFYINRVRGLIGAQPLSPSEPPGLMRAMLSVPQAFYNALHEGGTESGSRILRTQGISKGEFRQLEYFFIPINLNEHSSLIIVSPLDHTIELADSRQRSYRSMSKIFYIIIRFLIHELRTPDGFTAWRVTPWKFLYGQALLQESSADCENYTCLYTKALALQRPLTPETDLGQGPNYENERYLKNAVINDLEVPVWAEELFPMGKEDPIARHYGRDTASVPQHRLFWTYNPDNDGAEAVNPRTLRSKTGRHDHRNAKDLSGYCSTAGQVNNRGGPFEHRMRDYEQWALLSLPEFIAKVEEREADILNGEFPEPGDASPPSG